MRHQVERLKHVALKQGAKPARALTAALVAVGMMGAMAVTSIMPKSSAAAASTDNATAGICTPKDIHMGGDVSAGGSDTDAATYVGGDMYVGAKPDDINDLNNGNGPKGSYAVEAEGLTVVKGKAIVKPLKNSWGGKGFRWGIVGFGSQIRPADGSTVLAIGGDSSTSVMSNTNASIGAWNKSSWIGRGSTSEADHSYNALLAGANLGRWGADKTPSLNAYSTSGKITADANALKNVNIKKKTDSGSVVDNKVDFSNYKASKIAESDTLAGMQPTSTDVVSAVSEDTVVNNQPNYTRYKYNYGANSQRIKYDFYFDQNSVKGKDKTQKELKITFTGTNNPSLEVFNINPAVLNSADYDGISFAFKNISEKASVLINVLGDGTSNSNVTFHNGWRFWWNDQEISNGYVDDDGAKNAGISDSIRNAYSHAASHIMWNFHKVPEVKILGGEAHAGNENKYSNKPRTSSDDPAAAMLGSIMVPEGNFESHVSTNGRVYVGGDFSMYNPDGAFSAFPEGMSASVIDMDQERHNFPWSMSYTSSCAALTWQKVDAEDSHLLSGSRWGIYASEEDAQKGDVTGSDALLTVTDNDLYDMDQADGKFKVSKLNPNATYYLKELVAPTGYVTSGKIYSVQAGGEGSETQVTGDGNGYMKNSKAGASVKWAKSDKDDDATTANANMLSGSEWELKDSEGNNLGTITDTVAHIEGVTIRGSETGSDITELNLEEGKWSQLYANVTPSDLSDELKKVTWTSSNPNVVEVTSAGAVHAKSLPDGQDSASATITATAVDGTTHGTITVTVTKPKVNSLTVKNGSAEVANGSTLRLSPSESVSLTATVDPDTVTPNWTATDSSVARIEDQTENQWTTVKLTAGSQSGQSTTVTVQAGAKKVTFTVLVKEPTATVYFNTKSSSQNYWQEYWLRYQSGSSKVWQWAKMSGTCGDYVYAEVPLSDAVSGNEFYFRDARSDSSAHYYQKSGKKNWTFNGGSVRTVNRYDNDNDQTPSDCTVSAQAADGNTPAAAKSVVVLGSKSVRSVKGTASHAMAQNGSTYVDVDPNPGKFQIDGLPKGTYTLVESKAPQGYGKVSDISFTVNDDGSVTWGSTDGTFDTASQTFVIKDPRQLGSVTWKKVDADNTSKLLKGSVWKLIRTHEYKNSEYVKLNSPEVHENIADCVSNCSSTKDNPFVDTDSEVGVLKLANLPWGKYELVETKAPDGYNLTTERKEFTVGPGGIDVASFNVTNTPGAVLPGTGGEGLNKIYAAGLLAVTVAVAGLALSLRRRQL